MQATEGFCERIGVAEEKDKNPAWVLSRRETRMLNALIRAEKEKEGLEVLSALSSCAATIKPPPFRSARMCQCHVSTRVETKEKDGTTITKTTMETRHHRFDNPRNTAWFAGRQQFGW